MTIATIFGYIAISYVISLPLAIPIIKYINRCNRYSKTWDNQSTIMLLVMPQIMFIASILILTTICCKKIYKKATNTFNINLSLAKFTNFLKGQ